VCSSDLRGGGAVGLLPDAAPSVGLGFDLALLGPLHLAADATVYPEARIQVDGAAYAFGLTTATIAACYEHPLLRARIMVGGCVGVAAGLHHAVVYGLTPSAPGAYPWAGAATRARAGARVVGPLFFELGVQLTAAFARYEYFVSDGVNESVIFTQPVFAFAFDVGLGLAF
jgi:hypothetical protein